MFNDLGTRAAMLEARLRDLRRRLHRTPELGLDLPRTQALLLAEIDDLGLEISVGRTCSSIVAVLRGGRPGPTVLLRGDMDALPLAERTGLDFASENGAMHACGHDLHMAGLVGAILLLAPLRTSLAGDVVFMFQPGEEGHHGAQLMLDEGLLEVTGRRPERAYAIHVFADQPNGAFQSRPGPIMAAVDRLDVHIQGSGGHGALPHRTIDPIPIAAEIVLAMQSYVARRLSAFEPVVMTIGEFHSGTARHVVPDSAQLTAGVRSFDSGVRERLGRDLPALARGIADSHGAVATTAYESADPVTMNDPQAVDSVRNVVTSLLGAQSFNELAFPHTIAEDFSRVLQEVPGAMIFLGAAPEGTDPANAPTNHSSLAVFDDSVLPAAAAVLAGLALQTLVP